jgi:hypothetical protein
MSRLTRLHERRGNLHGIARSNEPIVALSGRDTTSYTPTAIRTTERAHQASSDCRLSLEITLAFLDLLKTFAPLGCTMVWNSVLPCL